MQTTWTTNGRKHIARKGKLVVGRITESQCITNEPFFAVSLNEMTKDFFFFFHAKDWIEDIAECIDETDFME
jgi:hypothetical protein